MASIDQIASDPPNQERVAGYRIDEDQSGGLAQPGRNVTGMSMIVPEVAAKRLNLLSALAASELCGQPKLSAVRGAHPHLDPPDG